MCDKEYICFSEALRTIGDVNKYECVMNSMVSVNVSKHDKPKGRCQKNGFIWDFVQNIGPHPPTAHVWDKVVKKRRR